MSTEQDQIRSLAERVARRLSEGGGEEDLAAASGESQEFASLRASLREMRERLAHLESHITHDETCAGGDAAGAKASPAAPAPTSARSTWLSGTYVPATSGAHPSEERFDVGEAVSELVDFFERERVCNLEPGGKPCDQCAMCSSRGF